MAFLRTRVSIPSSPNLSAVILFTFPDCGSPAMSTCCGISFLMLTHPLSCLAINLSSSVGSLMDHSIQTPAGSIFPSTVSQEVTPRVLRACLQLKQPASPTDTGRYLACCWDIFSFIYLYGNGSKGCCLLYFSVLSLSICFIISSWVCTQYGTPSSSSSPCILATLLKASLSPLR